MFKFVDIHGHKINKLYHGEHYRLRVEIISPSSSSSHQSSSSSPSEEKFPIATGPKVDKGGGAVSSSSSITSTSFSSYHLYVKNCFIFNGNESDVEFLDGNGCPKLASVSAFHQIGHNIAEAEIGSMFKLPNTNQLHLQCLVELVDNCQFCDSTLCPLSSLPLSSINNNNNNDTRRNGKKHQQQPSDMQMLASTTAYVFEPDQQMTNSHASILQSVIGGAGGGAFCSEWRFPWLIALCIMLGVLLIIMMVVNIFLCTSMSCSCFKHEVSEV